MKADKNILRMILLVCFVGMLVSFPTVENAHAGVKADAKFPNIITDLPQVESPIAGLNAYLVQGSDQQVVFMSFENDVEIPEHAHEAEWAVVLEGKIELTINDKKQIYEKGETYFIPKNVRHSSKISAGYKGISLFNQRDRYKVRDRK